MKKEKRFGLALRSVALNTELDSSSPRVTAFDCF